MNPNHLMPRSPLHDEGGSRKEIPSQRWGCEKPSRLGHGITCSHRRILSIAVMEVMYATHFFTRPPLYRFFPAHVVVFNNLPWQSPGSTLFHTVIATSDGLSPSPPQSGPHLQQPLPYFVCPGTCDCGGTRDGMSYIGPEVVIMAEYGGRPDGCLPLRSVEGSGVSSCFAWRRSDDCLFGRLF
jgi:hypothetical protein